MNTQQGHWRRRAAIVVLSSLLLVAIVLRAGAALRVQRPILDGGGTINQGYLWMEYDDFGGWHRGVDFGYVTGTHVYATANGTVRDLEESHWYPGNEGTGFGNFVLVEHDERHWDRRTGEWAYVYSIYAHLDYLSVRPSVGHHVNAGQWIADVDRTGHATGPHLHLQVCIHPQPGRTIDNLNHNATSRNPELWLEPFNSTGSVMV